MSGEPDQFPEALPTAGDAEGMAAGATLREARLRRGLTIGEVAADTRINPAYLEAMEAERWELLPAPVYARGFLRAYGRYLRLDAVTIEAMLPSHLPRPADLEPAPGLRRKSAEPALTLPSLRWLRRLDLRPPRPARPRPTTSVAPTRRVAGPPGRLVRTAGSARSGAGGARWQEWLATGQRAATMIASRLTSEPRALGIAAGSLVLLLLAVLGYSQLGGTSAPSSSVSTTATAGSGQVAGPEPAATTAATGTPSPTREGAMPDLIGRTRREAEDELTRLGLAYVVIEVTTPAATPGSVYNHSPQAGKAVKRGDSVTLLVARAP